MIQAIYFVLFLISAGYLILLLTRFQKHISVYYFLLAVSVVIVNLGFLQISGAKTLEAALVGNQVVYLAAPLLMLFMISAIADLCRVRVPMAVKVLRAFPSKIQVTFQVGMSQFRQIKAEDFHLFVPYEELLRLGGDKYTVRLQHIPEGATHVRLNPQQVDFLIEQSYNE